MVEFLNVSPRHSEHLIQYSYYCLSRINKVITNKLSKLVMLVKFDCGPTKLQVVKLVKEFMNLDLKEAKDACDLGSIEIEGWRVEDFIRQLRNLGGEVLNCGSQAKEDTNPPCALQYPLVKIGDTYKLNNNITFVITEVHSVVRNSIIEFKCIGEIKR